MKPQLDQALKSGPMYQDASEQPFLHLLSSMLK